jgi:methylmalonyl-CoA mutase
MPKLRIEEAAARMQARIDAGAQTVIGLNKYRPREEEGVDVLEVDGTHVRMAQIEKLRVLRAERDPAAVRQTLAALRGCAETQQGNLLASCIDAARAKATVGEMSLALEQVFGRHQARVQSVSGAYSHELGDASADLNRIRERVAVWAQREGRRPRILIAKMGQDGHDRGQKVVASAYADLGFDVDIGPLFQTPTETARQAVENDVHVVGVSSLSAGHLTLVPELRTALARLGRADIVIVVGGVIPPQHRQAVLEAGAAAIFPPGTIVTQAAEQLLDILDRDAS